jgi:hypothetical protein
MRAKRSFVVTVLGTDGHTHTGYAKAKNLREARRDARDWVQTTDWSASLVDVTPVDESSRLLAVAATTFVVAGSAIAAAMLVGLSLEGAL